MKDEEELIEQAQRSREETEELREHSAEEQDRGVEPWAPEPGEHEPESGEAA